MNPSRGAIGRHPATDDRCVAGCRRTARGFAFPPINPEVVADWLLNPQEREKNTFNQPADQAVVKSAEIMIARGPAGI
jgi:hypothetical protein